MIHEVLIPAENVLLRSQTHFYSYAYAHVIELCCLETSERTFGLPLDLCMRLRVFT